MDPWEIPEAGSDWSWTQSRGFFLGSLGHKGLLGTSHCHSIMGIFHAPCGGSSLDPSRMARHGMESPCGFFSTPLLTPDPLMRIGSVNTCLRNATNN